VFSKTILGAKLEKRKNNNDYRAIKLLAYLRFTPGKFRPVPRPGANPVALLYTGYR
jgi:hypothetical protein